MIAFQHKGNFNNTENFLDRIQKMQHSYILNKYAQEGVNALAAATPTDTGKTASSWYYKVEMSKGIYKIIWCNSNIVDGVPVAVLIQYGHGTKNGGYVEGIDYINPALRPIFDKITDKIWKEVTKQ